MIGLVVVSVRNANFLGRVERLIKHIGAPWLNTQSADEAFVTCMKQLKQTDFISFHDDFIKFIGIDAQMSVLHSFEGEDTNHVHEAPVFLPQTNEFLFADTSVVGWLWVYDINTNKVNLP